MNRRKGEGVSQMRKRIQISVRGMAVNVGSISNNKIDDDCDGNGMVRLS